MKIIDLSKTIQYNPGDPFFMKVKIKHKTHRASRWLVRAFGLPFRLFPKAFMGWADDEIRKMGVPLYHPPRCALALRSHFFQERKPRPSMKFLWNGAMATEWSST